VRSNQPGSRAQTNGAAMSAGTFFSEHGLL
jgi:hypothetical protein